MVLGKRDKQKVAALEQQVKALEARLLSKDVDLQQALTSFNEWKATADRLQDDRSNTVSALFRLKLELNEVIEHA